METSELIKKVRKLEIKTRGLSKQLFSGDYHSTFKGKGMAFSEVREYYPGDDIRTIDWNVTARTAHPHVKIFEEERELTVMLLVDISASEFFGSRSQFKKDLITELCAIISFAALQNNDKIGLLFFSDKVELFIPPKKGKSHILRIIRELIEFHPVSKGTDINVALKYFANIVKKRSVAFLISDFIAPADYEQSMSITGKKHDTIALQVFDQREAELPELGMIKLTDAETGEKVEIDSSSRIIQQKYAAWWTAKQQYLETAVQKSKIDLIQIKTDEDYILPLKAFFKKRETRR